VHEFSNIYYELFSYYYVTKCPVFSPEKILFLQFQMKILMKPSHQHSFYTSSMFYGALLNKLEHTLKIPETLLKCTKQQEKKNLSDDGEITISSKGI